MNTYFCKLFQIALVISMLTSCDRTPSHKQVVHLSISMNDTLYSKEVSGKLIFLFSKDTSQSLVYGVNHEQAHPVFTFDVTNWNPKEPLIIKNYSDSWHKNFSELDGIYATRLIFDFDTLTRSSFVTKGNSYSKKQIIELSKETVDTLSFEIENKFNGWIFNPSNNITEVRLKSKTLSSFWNKDMFVEAAVILPESYDKNKQKKYPLVFVFPGFGSHHASVTYGDGQIMRYGMNTVGEDKIFVYCNGEFKNGYHHFTNSENNGPWADAFVQEFLPFIEEKYNVLANNKSRFLMGQSSGGWTATWLQINYPEIFSGAFIASPDPLDFRAMAHNIYEKNANFYFPENPDSLQIQKGEKDKQYAILEDVIGEYGQIRTWEATFSPKGDNGLPSQLFDRESGEINPKVKEHWKKYDISKIIDSNPEYFRNQLSNKIYFFVSDDDPYHLEKSIYMLEEICVKYNIKLGFIYLEGLGHNVWIDKVREQIHDIIDKKTN